MACKFFWKHVLKQDWRWLEIIKPPQIHTLPDVLTLAEVDRLIAAARHLRYRVFILATYSMGLRLSETLALQVSDIDATRRRVHIRRGKGHKDRFVPLPDLTYRALRALLRKRSCVLPANLLLGDTAYCQPLPLPGGENRKISVRFIDPDEMERLLCSQTPSDGYGPTAAVQASNQRVSGLGASTEVGRTRSNHPLLSCR